MLLRRRRRRHGRVAAAAVGGGGGLEPDLLDERGPSVARGADVGVAGNAGQFGEVDLVGGG